MSVTRSAAIAYVSSVRDLQELKHDNDPHTVPEWLLIIRRQIEKAETAWYEGKKSEAIHRLAHVAACAVAGIEQNGQGPKTEEAPQVVVHGATCHKMPHLGNSGYLHRAHDDGPYDVDGVSYCGRCHESIL